MLIALTAFIENKHSAIFFVHPTANGKIFQTYVKRYKTNFSWFKIGKSVIVGKTEISRRSLDFA